MSANHSCQASENLGEIVLFVLICWLLLKLVERLIEVLNSWPTELSLPGDPKYLSYSLINLLIKKDCHESLRISKEERVFLSMSHIRIAGMDMYLSRCSRI